MLSVWVKIKEWKIIIQKRNNKMIKIKLKDWTKIILKIFKKMYYYIILLETQKIKNWSSKINRLIYILI